MKMGGGVIHYERFHPKTFVLLIRSGSVVGTMYIHLARDVHGERAERNGLVVAAARLR